MGQKYIPTRAGCWDARFIHNKFGDSKQHNERHHSTDLSSVLQITQEENLEF